MITVNTSADFPIEESADVFFGKIREIKNVIRNHVIPEGYV